MFWLAIGPRVNVKKHGRNSTRPALPSEPIDDGRRHTARRWRGSWVETELDELDAVHYEAAASAGTREFLGLRLARGPLP